MSACPFCAEALPGPDVERCPTCGTRLVDDDDDEPEPPPGTPVGLVLGMVVGTGLLGLGGCCGLGSVANAISLATIAPGSPGMVAAGVFFAAALGLGYSALHVGAGAFLLVRRRVGRPLGVTCAATDVALSLVVLGLGVSGNRSDRPLLYIGSALTAVALAALFALVHPATRQAYADAERRREREQRRR